MNNMDEISKVAKRFYADLYATNAVLGNSIEIYRLVGQALRVTQDEVAKALKGMKRGKSAGEETLEETLY